MVNVEHNILRIYMELVSIFAVNRYTPPKPSLPSRAVIMASLKSSNILYFVGIEILIPQVEAVGNRTSPCRKDKVGEVAKHQFH